MPTITVKSMVRLRWLIKQFYKLDRIPTEAEALAEVENLERKRDAGTACDRAIKLWSILQPYYDDGRG